MKRTIVALLALAAPAAAQSPNPATPADIITVTASRTGPATETLGGTIVQRDAIAALQPLTALDLLDRVAGLRAFQKGGPAGGTYLSVRGGEPNFTLVLLDGVKLNDPTNSQGGAFDLSQLDPQALERIEVARGSLSAVHGADALAGVVNLRLRAPSAGERFGGARLAADTRGGVTGDATAGLGWADGGLLISAGATDSDDLQRGSDLSRRQGLLRLTQRAAGLDIAALALRADADRRGFGEDSGGPRLAVNRARGTRDTELTVLGLDVSHPGAIRPHVSLSWSRQDADAATPAIAPGVFDPVPAITADTRFERLEAVADLRAELSPALTLAAGAAYVEEDGRSRGAVDFGVLIPADFRIGRHIASGFVEATLIPVAALRATVGVRYDDPSTAGGRWTGRAAATLDLGRDLPSLYASVSEGYKLPSLYALAYPLIANPDLRPETSRSWEAGLSKSWDGGHLRLAWFDNAFRDLIDFDPALFTNVNRNRVTTEGVEAEVRAALTPALAAEGSLTRLSVSSPTPLRARPKWQAAARLAWTATDRLTVDAALRHTASRLDSSVPTGLVRLAGYTTADLGARLRLTGGLTLSAVAANLFDADYEDAIGFPAPGRTLRIAVAARF